jgi:hypothetical protein
MPASPWLKILDSPSDAHLVQFYGSDESRLASNVSKYLTEGLKNGEGALVIAVPAHLESFQAALDADLRKRVAWLDAQPTLDQFLRNGMPDWDLFEATIPPAMQRVRANSEGVRAYGEMVGILWSNGRHAAAIRLEQFWNRLLSRASFQLFCGYPIDVLNPAFAPASVDAILCNHTHIVPADGPEFETALCRAMEEVAGAKAERAEALMKSELFRARWGILPRSEGLILWMRRHLPNHADEILRRAKAYSTAQTA